MEIAACLQILKIQVRLRPAQIVPNDFQAVCAPLSYQLAGSRAIALDQGLSSRPKKRLSSLGGNSLLHTMNGLVADGGRRLRNYVGDLPQSES
jgi:hypothetical protein